MRGRTVAGVVGALAVAAGAVAVMAPVVAGSAIRSSTLVTAAAAPARLPAAPLPATLRERWAAPGVGSVEAAVAGGSVVAATADRITGRDPSTGAERWSYRRSDARLCGWTARDDVVVAVFARAPACSEMIALDAGTGARKWYRTADIGDSATLTSANGVVVLRSGDRLLAVDTVTGLNRWTSSKPGCRYGPVEVGALGAAAAVRCGDGRTLVVTHDAYTDKELFSVAAPGTDATVVAVDQSIAVLATVRGTPTLTLYDQRGRVQGRIVDRRLAPRPGARMAGEGAGHTVLVWTGAVVAAVDTRTRSVAWSVPALGPPTVDGERLLLAEPTGLVERFVTDGRPSRRATLGAEPPAGAILSRPGALVVATTPTGVTVYG